MYCIGMWIYAYTEDSSTAYKYVITMAVFSSTLATALAAALPKHQELTVYTYLPTVQLPLTAQYYEYMVISY